MKSLPKLLCAVTLLSMSGLVWASCPEGQKEHERSGECVSDGSGDLILQPNDSGSKSNDSGSNSTSKRRSIPRLNAEKAIDYYFEDRELDPIEGIWLYVSPEPNKYEVVIVKNEFEANSEYQYLGIITRGSLTWGIGQIKFRMMGNPSSRFFTGTYLNNFHFPWSASFEFEGSPGVLTIRTADYNMVWRRTGPEREFKATDVTRDRLENIPKAKLQERNEEWLFDKTDGVFFANLGKSRSFIEEESKSNCEETHITCEWHPHKVTVIEEYSGFVARGEIGFHDGMYIGTTVHIVGMPHIAETVINAVRKLRITNPEIEIYLDPVADDEIFISVAPDLAKLAQVLGDPKKKRRTTSGSVAQSTGTGFLITRQGHVLTNSHVVDECNEIKVVTKGERVESVLVSQDSRNDIAILKIPGNYEVSASFRGGRGIRPGDEIIALGYPLQGLLSDDLKITQGIVNALAGLENDTRMMQISAPVQPGNSGGPLLDQAGNVVGIVTAKMNAVKMAEYTGDIPQNINFAIKASLARDFLDIKEIDYEISQSRDAKKLTDVFQQAKKFTVPIECW